MPRGLLEKEWPFGTRAVTLSTLDLNREAWKIRLSIDIITILIE